MIYNSFDNTGLVKVLRFLQAHNTEYLSGQDLSDVLRISRVAVWKHIKKIQEIGYAVESKQKRGYKLLANSDKLLPWEITSDLRTEVIGQRAYYFDSVDSTQKQALKMADDAVNDGAVVVASEQTDGKGRNGRRWVSPNGGIWISVILQPKFEISMATLFPIASALALSFAIEKTFSIRPELKWPNDLTVNGKKMAGMLVDVSLESNKIENMVLGAGINFDVDARQIERSLEGTPNFYGVASLRAQNNGGIKPVELVQVFLVELEKIYKMLCAKQVKEIIAEWTARSSTIGRDVELDTTEKKIKGKAVKIDDDGALVVALKNNKTCRIISGNVTHLSK